MNTEQKLEKLEKFEQAITDLQCEYNEVCAQVDELRDAGKMKSATCQQLTARKLTLQSMISYFKMRGLVE